MRKAKYIYNPQTLKFEKVKISPGMLVLRAFGFVSASFVFASLLMYLGYLFIDSPKEKFLKREIKEYKLQLEIIEKRMEQLNLVMDELASRDDQIYRVIFEATPIPNTVRNAGVGGAERYREFENLENGDLLIRCLQQIDQLTRKFAIQSRSYDEISSLATKKNELLASIPAIQPVSNKELARIASGFGYRIHPIYKTSKMHTGMDFTAPVGTEIYATGNGTVEFSGSDRGYGRHIIINHGFGYQTLYAHMSELKVKRGQKVSRGEIIGYIGNSGQSTGPHLHYEVIKNGNKINPINFYFNDLSPEEYDKLLEMAESANQSFD